MPVNATSLLPPIGNAIGYERFISYLVLAEEVRVGLNQFEADAIVNVFALVIPHGFLDAEAGEILVGFLALHLKGDLRIVSAGPVRLPCIVRMLCGHSRGYLALMSAQGGNVFTHGVPRRD